MIFFQENYSIRQEIILQNRLDIQWLECNDSQNKNFLAPYLPKWKHRLMTQKNFLS